MAHPYHHALSSVQRWGGVVEDYLGVHNWFDNSKAFVPDFRHRALRHHAEGIFWAEEVFGTTITNADGRVVPLRWIGEQHVKDDLGWLPTLQDWFKHLRIQPWMAKAGDRKVGRGETEPVAPASTAPQAVSTEVSAGAADIATHRPILADVCTRLYRVVFVPSGETAERFALARARSYAEAAEAVWDHHEETHGATWPDGQVLQVQLLCEPETVGIVYEPAGSEQSFVVVADRLVLSAEAAR